ncbi:MAG: helix-hairpin-helix domain-containing protein [Clostridia bacterium]|nr:helix-hairpin-helix domain-containing protein [Clostridia bacterium]
MKKVWEDILICAVAALFAAGALYLLSPRHFTGHASLGARSTESGSGIIVMEDGQVLIDINEADAGLLMSLPGIGEKTAAAIVAEREENGPFSCLEELSRVNGIGPKTVEALEGIAAAG